MLQAVPAVPGVAMKSVPTTTTSLVSSQYRAQEEDNVYTGAVGGYTAGRNTVNYVADAQ